MANLILIYVAAHCILWIPAAFLAWFRSRIGIVLISVRLGLFAAFLAIALPLSAASAPVIGPQGLILMLVEVLLVAIFATDIAVWVISLVRNPPHRRFGLVSALASFATPVTGFGVAATVWSEHLPDRLLASAAEFAGERAYCIMNGPEAANTRRDLTALAIWWQRGQISPDMHSILVVEDPNGARTFANWSFLEGRYVELTPSALNVLEAAHLACQPRPQFTNQL